MSEILGYDFNLVRYAMINTKCKDISYKLHPDSDWPSDETLKEIKENSIDFEGVNFWKPALWFQYYIPHDFQIKAYPPFEFILTWMNKMFLKSKKILVKLTARQEKKE